MKLSIIVPVYNMAADGKLTYCLDSLVNQTVKDYEIIAVDDASTDESPKILEAYAQKYPEKFRAVYSKVNRRQGGAKNLGLEHAQGDWIGFMDSDDWAAPDMYEKMLRKAEETGADMVGCDYNLTYEHSMQIGEIVPNNRIEQTGVLNEEKYRWLILDSGSLVVKIYKRHIILGYDNRFPEHIFYEDNAISNSWMLRAKHFAYIQEPLYYYYQHAVSTVHTITRKRCEDRMQAGRVMIEEAKRYGYLEQYRPEIEYSFTLLFFINTLFSYMQGVKKKEYGFVKLMIKEMKSYFPNFMENPYYQEKTPEEEKKLIAMLAKNPLLFWCYYRLLQTYRTWRKAVKK